MYLGRSDSGAIKDFMSEEDMERAAPSLNEERLQATRFLNDCFVDLDSAKRRCREAAKKLNDAKSEAGTAEEDLQKKTDLCQGASKKLAALCEVVR